MGRAVLLRGQPPRVLRHDREKAWCRSDSTWSGGLRQSCRHPGLHEHRQRDPAARGHAEPRSKPAGRSSADGARRHAAIRHARTPTSAQGSASTGTVALRRRARSARRAASDADIAAIRGARPWRANVIADTDSTATSDRRPHSRHGDLRQRREFTYTFENFFHPFVGELIEQAQQGIAARACSTPNFHESLSDGVLRQTSITRPLSNLTVKCRVLSEGDRRRRRRAVRQLQLGAALPHPADDRRASEQEPALRRGAALVPLHLRPDRNDTTVPAPQRFWKFLAFRKDDDATQIDELLALLSKPDAECTDGGEAQGARS